METKDKYGWKLLVKFVPSTGDSVKEIQRVRIRWHEKIPQIPDHIARTAYRETSKIERTYRQYGNYDTHHIKLTWSILWHRINIEEKLYNDNYYLTIENIH